MLSLITSAPNYITSDFMFLCDFLLIAVLMMSRWKKHYFTRDRKLFIDRNRWPLQRLLQRQ